MCSHKHLLTLLIVLSSLIGCNSGLFPPGTEGVSVDEVKYAIKASHEPVSLVVDELINKAIAASNPQTVSFNDSCCVINSLVKSESGHGDSFNISFILNNISTSDPKYSGISGSIHVIYSTEDTNNQAKMDLTLNFNGTGEVKSITIIRTHIITSVKVNGHEMASLLTEKTCEKICSTVTSHTRKIL